MHRFQNRILFLTTTIGTRWIFYQQYLIKKHFPQSKTMLIDGNVNWDWSLGKDCTWYKFIEIAIKHQDQYDYFIHVDEDCFLVSDVGINECIELISTNQYQLMGPKDAFKAFRIANPMALNSFLMIGDIKSLANVWKSFNHELKFNELDIEKMEMILPENIEFEPYYNFFWNYYSKQYGIGFIDTDYSEEFTCTSLLTLSGQPFGYHMWYTRKWYKNHLVLNVLNAARYFKMEGHLSKMFKIRTIDLIGAVNMKALIPLIFSRVFTKSFIRVKRRLRKALTL